ncbi:MAG: transketolase [Coriobacteriales bacterium]
MEFEVTPSDVKRIAYGASVMRYDIVNMISEAGSGHPGGSLSAADIVASLYLSGIMNFSAENLKDPLRDRFILSKGHAAPVLYAALAQVGIIERDELMTLRKLHSRLQGHPDCLKLPGVEVSTGSLGQGLSISCGLALGLRMTYGDDAPTVFTLIGDGESQEGQIWEAAEFANQYKLGNLVAILDYNNLQIDGHCSDIMDPAPVSDRWRAFGWKVIVVDGHDIPQICDALAKAKAHTDGPVMIVAATTKGKGVSFMEDEAGWHGKAPDAEQAKQALDELSLAMEKAREDMEG